MIETALSDKMDEASRKQAIENVRRLEERTFICLIVLMADVSKKSQVLVCDVICELADPLNKRKFELSQDKEITDVLKKLLKSCSEDVVVAALFATARVGAWGLLDEVIAHAKHKNARCRECVAIALQGIDTESSIECLIRMTKDRDDAVREAATEGIGDLSDLSDERVVDALVGRLEDSSYNVRVEAMIGLEKRKDLRANSAIYNELSKSQTITLRLIRAAEKVADPSLVGLLQTLFIRDAEVIGAVSGVTSDEDFYRGVARAIVACRFGKK